MYQAQQPVIIKVFFISGAKQCKEWYCNIAQLTGALDISPTFPETSWDCWKVNSFLSVYVKGKVNLDLKNGNVSKLKTLHKWCKIKARYYNSVSVLLSYLKRFLREYCFSNACTVLACKCNAGAASVLWFS